MAVPVAAEKRSSTFPTLASVTRASILGAVAGIASSSGFSGHTSGSTARATTSLTKSPYSNTTKPSCSRSWSTENSKGVTTGVPEP